MVYMHRHETLSHKSIIETGRKLGIKSKNEDIIGRILKGMANIFNENDFVRNKSNRSGHIFLHI